jgi:hypothetical protein
MTPPEMLPSLREWTRRVWGALSGRRTDQDLQRELAGHLALAEDELRRQGHAPNDAARLARAAAGGASRRSKRCATNAACPGSPRRGSMSGSGSACSPATGG